MTSAAYVEMVREELLKNSSYTKEELSGAKGNELIMDEIVARSSEDMLTNSDFMVDMFGYLKQDQAKTFVDKISQAIERFKNWVSNFIAKYKDATFGIHDETLRLREEGMEQYFEELLNYFNGALEESIKYRAATQNENVGSSIDDGAKYSIRYTTDNKRVAVLDEDILKDVDEEDWPRVAKNVIKQLNQIQAGNNIIYVNKESYGKFTHSKELNNLKVVDKQRYYDILRTASNIEDLVLASTDYVNELRKEREGKKKRFSEFGRGIVLIQAGNNQYYGEVDIGLNGENRLVFYTLANVVPTKFTLKKEANSSPRPSKGLQMDLENASITNVSQAEEKSSTISEDGFRASDRVINQELNLVAVHGTTEDKLMKALELEGLPGISSAVINIDEGLANEDYGEISLVFDKNTIDPARSGNTVYGADAWTPTHNAAQVEYKVDTNKARNFDEKMKNLSSKILDGIFSNYSHLSGILNEGSSSETPEELLYRFDRSDED